MGRTNVRPYSDDQVLGRVKSNAKGFKGWPGTPDKPEVMDVWVRSDEDEFDAFDDKAYTYKCYGPDREPQFIMVTSGTTNTGSYGLLHFEEYNHEGAAVLEGDRIVYQSHAFGYHHGQEAYRQVKPFPYHRDNNRNKKVEEIGPLHENEIIGAHEHRAGVNSTVIKNWSTACMVRNVLEQFMAWIGFMKREKKPPLSLCILNEW